MTDSLATVNLNRSFKEYIEALGGSPEFLAPYAYDLIYWQNMTGIKRVHKKTLINQWDYASELSAEGRKKAEDWGLPCPCYVCESKRRHSI